MFENINLEKELRQIRRNREEELLSEVNDLLVGNRKMYELIQSRLGASPGENTDEIDIPDRENVFHVNDIHELCSKYRLRFLPTSLFKGEIPFDALSRVAETENAYGVKFNDFKIAAPAGLFKLKDSYKDPVLFARISESRYYLIHKWGNDLHWSRPVIFYPVRNYRTFINSVLVLAAVLASIVPSGWLVRSEILMPHILQYRILFFITCCVWLGVIGIYVWMVSKKSFSEEEVTSKYFN